MYSFKKASGGGTVNYARKDLEVVKYFMNSLTMEDKNYLRYIRAKIRGRKHWAEKQR